MYVDGGFHSEDVHNLAKMNKVNIHLTNMTGRESAKEISATDFDIDHQIKLIIKCPAGHGSKHANVTNSQTSAHYTKDECGNCPLY